MFLEKKISFNNGIHYSYKLTRVIPAFFKFKMFSFKSNLKRNKTLKKNNLRSINHIKLKTSFKNILKKNTIFFLKFLIQFVLSSFSYKILSLFCCSNGLFFYAASTSLHKLFRFYKNKIYTIRRRYKFKKDAFFLFKLKRLDTFCVFSFSFDIKNKYALAIGAKAKLVKIEKNKNIGIVELPSKAKKIISLYTCVYKGRVKTFSLKKLKITKAGYLRLRGKKANSRGLAMNPVDHPHGGKTGSLKLHRTPWGTVAKLK